MLLVHIETGTVIYIPQEALKSKQEWITKIITIIGCCVSGIRKSAMIIE